MFANHRHLELLVHTSLETKWVFIRVSDWAFRSVDQAPKGAHPLRRNCNNHLPYRNHLCGYLQDGNKRPLFKHQRHSHFSLRTSPRFMGILPLSVGVGGAIGAFTRALTCAIFDGFWKNAFPLAVFINPLRHHQDMAS